MPPRRIGDQASMVNIGSIEIEDDKFFSLQRGKSNTYMPKTQKPEKTGYIKESKTESQLKNEKVITKIESSLKGLNSLSFIKKHPFDLSSQDLEDLKQHFP